MFETVQCPYCNHKNDMSDGLVDLPDDNRFDHECENCEKEFEVYVEFQPIYKSSKIEYFSCEECGLETRDPYQKGKVFPFPKHLEKKTLCNKCYLKGMNEEFEMEEEKRGNI